MLWQTGKEGLLEMYVADKREKELSRWWGRCLVSENKPDSLNRALEVYAASEDHIERVKVYCMLGKLDHACRVAEEARLPRPHLPVAARRRPFHAPRPAAHVAW